MSKFKPGHMLSDHPELLCDWDQEQNDALPCNITESSNQTFWWKCHVCGHRWQSKVSNRFHGNGCPACCGLQKMRQTKRTQGAIRNGSLAEKRPDWLAEWDYNKNTISPEETAEKSNYRAWWICPKGHSYSAIICNRTNLGRGCPICAGKQVLPGFNDLATKRPDIAKRWDYSKNPCSPSEVLPGSNKKYYWLCELGHSYLSSVANLTSGATKGCPYCAGQKVLKGFNDLATLYPDIAKEWDASKNGKRADETTCGSKNSYWWECPNGHSYQARITHRIIGCNCPKCSKCGTSVPEFVIMHYLDSHKIQYIHRYKTKWLKRSEVDFYFPALNMALEYDGILWHKDATRDINKNALCAAHGIEMIRFREHGLPDIDNCTCFPVPYLGAHMRYYKALENPIISLLKKLQIHNIDVNIDRDIKQILQDYRDYKTKDSETV